ncbi:hypothetical protein SVAN01_07816 [Stagonosporopsis vannaccii]|nr:hypothetical protein SVAN01_07816 [Stagonosporopsis vannaccii]
MGLARPSLQRQQPCARATLNAKNIRPLPAAPTTELTPRWHAHPSPVPPTCSALLCSALRCLLALCCACLSTQYRYVACTAALAFAPALPCLPCLPSATLPPDRRS